MTEDETVYAMDLKYVDQVTLLDSNSMGDSLALGSTMLHDLKKQQLRWLATHPRRIPSPWKALRVRVWCSTALPMPEMPERSWLHCAAGADIVFCCVTLSPLWDGVILYA